MEKDLGKALEQAVSNILRSREEARVLEEKQKEKQRQDYLVLSRQVEKDYQEKILPFKQEFFASHVPQYLLDFLDVFANKVFFETKKKFSPQITFSGPYNDAVSVEEKAKALQALSQGTNPSIVVKYFGTELDGSYFGLRIDKDKNPSWFIANLESGEITGEEEDIAKMVDAFAKVLTSGDPLRFLKEYHHFEPVDNRI